MALACDYRSLSLTRTASPRVRISSTSSDILQDEVKNYFVSLNKLSSKILLERENVATSHSHLPQQQKEEVIKEHFIPTMIRARYPRLSQRWASQRIQNDVGNSSKELDDIEDDTESVNSVCSTVLTGFQREVEVDIPPIDPSIPYKEPPCPLDRKASVRMSFRVPKKSSSGKETKYEYLRRKLSLRPPKATQVVGDVRNKRTVYDNSINTTTQHQNQLTVYPETGERTLPQSSTARRSVKPNQSPATNKQFSDNHHYSTSSGTLSQPAGSSQDFASRGRLRRDSSRHSHSPLISSLASSPPQSSYYSQLQLPQTTNGQRGRNTTWQRVASASVPSSTSAAQSFAYGSSHHSSVRGYSRVMSNCQPTSTQRVDFHTRHQPPANLVRAPHVVREETSHDQRNPSLPAFSHTPNRGRHVSGVSTQSEGGKSRRRHRSQSPANILSRSHNEYRYEQSKVRSHSTDRCLDELQEERHEKRRSNSVDFDLISPVDNTSRYPNSPRPHRNAHELSLVSQRRGGSTYTTATSSYAHLGRKKPNKTKSPLSQSAETLTTGEGDSRKTSSATDEGAVYGSPPFFRQAKESSLTVNMAEGRHLRQARVSADSGYTSPTDHETGPRSLREKSSHKQFPSSLESNQKGAPYVRVIGPTETMETHW